MGQYFGFASSTRDPRARQINRKTRKLWVEHEIRTPSRYGVGPYYSPGYWSLKLAILSADTASEAMANVKAAVTQDFAPPEQGGRHSSLEERLHLAQEEYLGFSTGHLRDEEAAFYTEFFAYLKGLAASDDPVERVAANRIMLGLTSQFSLLPAGVQNVPDNATCMAGLLQAYRDLAKTYPDKPQPMLQPLSTISMDIWSNRTMPLEKQIQMTEEILGPYVESGDVDALMAWNYVGYMYWAPNYDQSIVTAGGYYRLLQRVCKVLAKRQDDPKVREKILAVSSFMNAWIDEFRTRLEQLRRERGALERAGRVADAASVQTMIDRYLAELPPLATRPETGKFQVRMLLGAKEWPLHWNWRWDGWPYARVQCRDRLIWVAISDNVGANPQRKAGLVGLDPAGGGSRALWQATRLPGHGGEHWVEGLVLGRDHSYIALRDSGIVVLPGTATQGQGLIQEPRMLGPKDGLPASAATAIGGTPEQMWVAFGRQDEEHGLGLYNALTGQWKTCFASTSKGNGPLPSGGSYVATTLAAVPDGVILNADRVSGKPAWGLWHYDLQSGTLQQLVDMQECYLSTVSSDGAWFQYFGVMVSVDAMDKALKVALIGTHDYWVRSVDGGWPIQHEAFSPPDDERHLGAWMYGSIDLTTAAIHGDELWARAGQTQIVILKRGQKVGEGRKIDNDILDGGPVLQFFDTPYGLLAVGEGSVGLIEDEPGQ
jgi:hypothetical protein